MKASIIRKQKESSLKLSIHELPVLTALKSKVKLLLTCIGLLLMRTAICIPHEFTIEHFLLHHSLEIIGVISLSITLILVIAGKKLTKKNKISE